MAEMIKTTDELCGSCKYSKVDASPLKSRYICDYLCMTTKRRNCPVGQCDKYEKREGKRRGQFI